MKSVFLKLLAGITLGLYLGIPLLQTVKADDTEVYFLNGGLNEAGKPELLLMFEFSSAMNGNGRLEKIKQALELLPNAPLDDTDPNSATVKEAVNFGLGLFSKGSGGGGAEGIILYPAIEYSAQFDNAVANLLDFPVRRGNTPTLEGLSEAFRYFRGMRGRYYTSETSRLALPNPQSSSLYNSPGGTEGACSSKAVVLLAHGQRNGSEWPRATETLVGTDGRTPGNVDAYCTSGSCSGYDMTRFMEQNPVGSVKTYTIDPGASGANRARLDLIAENGGTGSAIDWDPSYDCFARAADGTPLGLCAILIDIIKEVASQGTSFVQAGVTVSQQNRLNHDNHLYFAQFQAENVKTWPGNLKKYRISNGALVDNSAIPGPAVGDDGLFLEERDDVGNILKSRSFWSDLNDGNQVELGGTLGQMNFLETVEDTFIVKDFVQKELVEVVNQKYQKFSSFSRNLRTDTLPSGKADSALINVDNDIVNELYFDMAKGDPLFSEIKEKTLGYWNIGAAETYEADTKEIDPNTGELFMEPDPENPRVDRIRQDIYTVFNPDVVEKRPFMGDPLHSVPKVVQYASGGQPSVSLAYIGTNQGVLHAFHIDDDGSDASTFDGGDEAWAYIPSEMLARMQTYMLEEDLGGDPEQHNYGLDGEITIAHNDINRNLQVDVDLGEIALLFVGMRRGGNKYFVLDISDPYNPTLRDIITLPDTAAQSWSQPIISNIDVKSGDVETSRTFAIFGGGYDDDQDGIESGGTVDFSGAYGKDDVGNTIVFYDIASRKSYDLSDSSVFNDSSLSLVRGKLQSIPANIRVISTDNDSSAENLYVVDTAGQLFRFDLYSDSSSSQGFNVKATLLASLGTPEGANSEHRRIFYAPTVAEVVNGTERYLAVAMGTGYRAHPKDEVIQDYFVMIKDTDVLSVDPNSTFKTITSVTSGQLTNVTDFIDPNPENQNTEIVAHLEGSQGWFIQLKGLFSVTGADGITRDQEHKGEKVLAEARIFFDKIIFTTFIPTVENSSSSCSPVLGSGKIYGVNIEDGTSFFDSDSRSLELISSGIPPLFQLLLTDDDYVGFVGNEVIGGTDARDDFIDDLVEGFEGIQRMNWRKKPNDN